MSSVSVARLHRACVTTPDVPHLPTRLEQLIERSCSLNPTVFEHDDLIRLPERRRPMADHQAHSGAVRAEPLPQQRLGLRIEGTGHVIEEEQRGGAHEQTRGGGPLHLPTGEPDAAGTHHVLAGCDRVLRGVSGGTRRER
jgi:hypothetical protein